MRALDLTSLEDATWGGVGQGHADTNINVAASGGSPRHAWGRARAASARIGWEWDPVLVGTATNSMARGLLDRAPPGRGLGLALLTTACVYWRDRENGRKNRV